MKKLAIIAVALAVGSSAFAQGVVRFANRVSGVFITPIHGVNPAAPGVQMTGNATTNGGAVNYTGVPQLTGTGFSASLFAAPLLSSTSTDPTTFEEVAVATSFSTSTTLPGVFNGNSALVLPGRAGNWNFQIRAWANNGGPYANWAAVLATDPAVVARGQGTVFTANAAVPPASQGNMDQFRSFNLVLVPEPSVIALGALGLGALLLRRRKQS